MVLAKKQVILAHLLEVSVSDEVSAFPPPKRILRRKTTMDLDSVAPVVVDSVFLSKIHYSYWICIHTVFHVKFEVKALSLIFLVQLAEK